MNHKNTIDIFPSRLDIIQSNYKKSLLYSDLSSFRNYSFQNVLRENVFSIFNFLERCYTSICAARDYSSCWGDYNRKGQHRFIRASSLLLIVYELFLAGLIGGLVGGLLPAVLISTILIARATCCRNKTCCGHPCNKKECPTQKKAEETKTEV